MGLSFKLDVQQLQKYFLIFYPKQQTSDLMKASIYSNIFDRHVTYFGTEEKLRNSALSPGFS